MDPVNALQVSDLRVRFGDTYALNGLTLSAAPSQITAILGPNGAGKTTLVRCCTAMLTPDSGAITVAGRTAPQAVAGGLIAVMPQSGGAWSGIRARELLSYLGTLYAHPHPIDDLAGWFGLRSFWDTPYRRLSGGQQQAVNFAAALIGRPSIVMLDEPTAGLDPHARRHTWQLMDHLREAGVTIVLTTHAMDEASKLADYVWIVDAGHVRLGGTVAQLTSTASLEEVYLAHTSNSFDPLTASGEQP